MNVCRVAIKENKLEEIIFVYTTSAFFLKCPESMISYDEKLVIQYFSQERGEKVALGKENAKFFFSFLFGCKL